MKRKAALLPGPGQPIRRDQLEAVKARELIRYLLAVESDTRFLEARRINETVCDVVLFEITVERPQVLAFDIRRVEPVAAIFPIGDNCLPQVVSLRSDFPSVPHVNLTTEEFPRCICLYEQSFEEIRLTWTPADFIRRIHHWFAGTARGTLHAEDQPLEPLISISKYKLILPIDFDPRETRLNPRACALYPVKAGDDTQTFRMVWRTYAATEKTDSVVAAFFCKPQKHGVIQRDPRNLFELNALCLKGGLDLAAELYDAIRGWFLNKQTGDVMEARLVLLIYLPKTRHQGDKTEATEIRAFLTLKKVREIGEVLQLLDKHGNTAGMLIGRPTISPEALGSIPVGIMQVHNSLNTKVAAVLNGYAPREDRVAAIGLGALGSQAFNNLLRSGFGKWTLIDDDVLLPHNCARHFLGDWAVGRNKAEAMAEVAQAIFNDMGIATSIPANILTPDRHEKQIEQALAKSSLILDMSASVAVGRHLAGLENHPRSVSVFVTPDGNSLAVLMEDKDRSVRLNWLEMLHYRAVLNSPALANSFRSTDSRIRYGNSCRDLTSTLSQDKIATWAGIASKAIKTVAADPKPVLWLYASDENGATAFHSETVEPPIRCSFCEWTIMIDKWLLRKLATLRSSRLPNETGGVLLGSFDTQRRICFIIDVIPSPPDSEEWPTSYIRGCEGLAAKVNEVSEQTLGQVTYVGEWHSHPRGASTNPSADDLTAYSWLVRHMNSESLPAIMMIIGGRGQFRLVSVESSVGNLTAIK